jgi:hypothetical protein
MRNQGASLLAHSKGFASNHQISAVALSFAAETNQPVMLRVRAKINSHFGASAGRADARRRDAGDVVTSSRSGNAADARPPPRPAGLPAREFLISYPVLYDGLGLCNPAAKCEVIFARALRVAGVLSHGLANVLRLKRGRRRRPIIYSVRLLFFPSSDDRWIWVRAAKKNSFRKALLGV